MRVFWAQAAGLELALIYFNLPFEFSWPQAARISFDLFQSPLLGPKELQLLAFKFSNLFCLNLEMRLFL